MNHSLPTSLSSPEVVDDVEEGVVGARDEAGEPHHEDGRVLQQQQSPARLALLPGASLNYSC